MTILLFFAVGATLVIATACKRPTQVAAVPGPPEVLVAGVQQKDVSGCLLKQEYTEGLFVRGGQMLFQIDAGPLRADVDRAEARHVQPEGRSARACARFAQAGAEIAVPMQSGIASSSMWTRYAPDSAPERHASRIRGVVSIL